MPIKVDVFAAGGGQGDDVLSQVDSYMDGRPKKGKSEVDANGNRVQPTILDQALWGLRDAIFGKPKDDLIRQSAAKTDRAKTESTLDNTLPIKQADDPAGASKGDDSLKSALKMVGSLFGL